MQADLQATLSRALDLATKCRTVYRQAPPKLRRELNQFFFSRLEVDDHGEVVSAEWSPPYRALLDEGLMGRVAEERASDQLAQEIGPGREVALNDADALAGVGSNYGVWWS